MTSATTERHRAAAPTRLRLGDLLALVVVLALIVAIVVPGVIAPGDPLAPAGGILDAPSWTHLLGTDYLGRDLLTRIVHGTGRTLAGSLIAVLIGLVGGLLLGVLAATGGRVADAVIGRVVDMLLSIPGLLLSMIIVVSLGFGALNAAIAVGIASVAVFTRLTRSEVLAVRERLFVEASRQLGRQPMGVLLQHVLPNVLPPVLALTALQFGSAILWIASLSFLGYGAPPPQPEWGLLVAEGREYLVSSPWLVVAPGAVIVVTVLAIARLSRALGELAE